MWILTTDNQTIVYPPTGQSKCLCSTASDVSSYTPRLQFLRILSDLLVKSAISPLLTLSCITVIKKGLQRKVKNLTQTGFGRLHTANICPRWSFIFHWMRFISLLNYRKGGILWQNPGGAEAFQLHYYLLFTYPLYVFNLIFSRAT